MPDPRSALAPVTTGAAELAAGLTCREMPVADLVMASTWPDTETEIFAAVGKTLEAEVPEDTRNAVKTAATTVFRVAPRRLMIVSDEGALFAPLQGVLDNEKGTLSQQDHSRVRIRLSGPGAAALLSRGAPIDLDERSFPAGAFAQTGIHHMWVLIHRVAEGEEFDLYVLRSFALSFWEWLVESAHIATQTSRGAHSLT